MKIDLLGPVYPYRGGIAHFTTRLAKEIKNHQHTLRVLSFRRQYPGWMYPGTTDLDSSSQAEILEALYLLDPVRPWTWWQTANEIASNPPQAVVIMWWSTFWAPAYFVLASLLRKGGIPIIYLIHNVLPHEQKPWDLWLARLALGRGNGFLVQTKREKERLLDLLPNSRVEISPHPIYDIFAGQNVPKGEARSRLGLPEDKPLLLFFGFVRPYKGLPVLLDAVARLHQRGEDFVLLIVGEFWEDSAQYIDEINRLEIQSCVRVIDRYIPNEDVALYFSGADVLVAPYLRGTQSGVVKLALGFGLPVVASQTIFDETMTGEYESQLTIVPPGDGEALANAILPHILSPLLHNPVGKNVGRGWGDMVETIERLVT